MSTSTDVKEREATDRAILGHVSLYRLTIASAVERTIFQPRQGVTSQDASRRTREALDALVQQRRLERHLFPKGEPYYVLAGAKRPPNTQTIDYDLATLWLCTMQPSQRFYRLETSEVRKLFPAPPHHHVRHILGDDGEGPVVYRLYPTAVDVKTTLKRLKGFIAESRGKLGLSSWLDCGDYGFVVCCESQLKASQVAEAIASRESGADLADEARIIVATAPSSSTIPKGGAA